MDERRHKLCQLYWRTKIPEQWKTPPAVKKSGNTTKRKRRTKRIRLETCRNAFHYLELKDPKKAPSTGTCNCLAISHKSEEKQKSRNRTIKEETENEATTCSNRWS